MEVISELRYYLLLDFEFNRDKIELLNCILFGKWGK